MNVILTIGLILGLLFIYVLFGKMTCFIWDKTVCSVGAIQTDPSIIFVTMFWPACLVIVFIVFAWKSPDILFKGVRGFFLR